MSIKRVFLIVLDSFGVGEAPDAEQYGDRGTDTLCSISKSPKFETPTLRKLGLFNLDGLSCGLPEPSPIGSYGKMTERSAGKDTTIGHWEIAGIYSPNKLPVYPDGFPQELLEEFSRRTGRGILCNKPYSGTQVIAEYGEEQMKTGKLIVYTSADSVFQIAAHEEVIPLEELYRDCQIAREMLQGEHAVGRVIARPYIGEPGNFKRTSNRHDYSLLPPSDTMLDVLTENGLDTIGVGKINDIFAGQGIQQTIRTISNDNGMEQTLKLQQKDFRGLCFVNLVDFDMVFGHRNDVDGYADAATRADRQLAVFLEQMAPDDVLMITADHGCDPGFTASTDHSREYTPMLVYGSQIKQGVNLHIRSSFADIAKTILEMFSLDGEISGDSFWKQIRK